MYWGSELGRRTSTQANALNLVEAVNKVFIAAIDHVQLAMPPGGEEAARRFYLDLLGMTELPKPKQLAQRGGCWFESGQVKVHLGVEEDFRPAKKAHPAFRCRNYLEFVLHLRAGGVEVHEVSDIPDLRRCYVADPFGNRIELIEG